MDRPDFVWVPAYRVGGHLRNRAGLLADKLSPLARSESNALDDMENGWRDPHNPSLRRRGIIYDSAVEDADGESIGLVDQPDLTKVYLAEAFVADHFGPSMLPIINTQRKEPPSRQRLYGRPGVRVFVNMVTATRTTGAYWLWVPFYAVPILNQTRGAYVLFACKDTLTYYVVPWQVIKAKVIKAPKSQGHYSFHLIPGRGSIRFRKDVTMEVHPFQHRLVVQPR